MVHHTEMLPLDKEFVKELTKPTQFQEFEGQYVKELERARDSVFIEICNEFKQGTDTSKIVEPSLRKNLVFGWKVFVIFWIRTAFPG